MDIERDSALLGHMTESWSRADEVATWLCVYSAVN